jgi:tetratricopeptide (TPR) repeat protein
MVHNMIGEYPLAQEYVQQAGTLARQSGDLLQESTATLIQTYIFMGLGDLKQCVYSSQRGRECLNLCGLNGGETDLRFLRAQAEVHSLKSEYREARAIYTQVIGENSTDLSPMNHGLSLLNIGSFDSAMGDQRQDAQQTIEKAKAIFSGVHMPHEVRLCDMILADLLGARALLIECFNEFQGYDAEGMLYCLEKLGDVSRWTSEHSDSMSPWTVLFFGQALKLKNKLSIHQALVFLGDAALANGDDATADSLFRVALDGFTEMDVHLGRGNCLMRLGDLAKRQGDLTQALQCWKRARPLFERAAQTGLVKKVDERLNSQNL